MELLEIERTDSDTDGSLKELLTNWRIPLLVTTSLAVFQQLTGHSNLLNFTSDIFRLSGFRGTAPAVLLGVVKVIATTIAILWVRSDAATEYLVGFSNGNILLNT